MYNKSYNKPIRSQENLKQILLNEPIKSIKLSKELINSIYYYSIKKKNKLETFNYFNTLTKYNKFRSLLPFIYFKMSEYKSNKEKFFFLKKSLLYSNNNKDMAFSLSNLIKYYQTNDKTNNNELFYLKKLIKVQIKLNDSMGLVKNYYNIGLFYKKEIDYFNAIESFAKSIEYSKKSNNFLLGRLYIEIAKIFYIIDKKNLTENFLNTALKISKKNKDNNLLSEIYLFYSNDYFNKKMYDKALKYIYKADEHVNKNNFINKKNIKFLMARILIKLSKRKKSKNILKNLITSEFNRKSYKNLLPIISFYTELLIIDNNLKEANAYILKIDDLYAPYYRYYYYYYYLKALYNQKQNNKTKTEKYFDKTLNSIDEVFNNTLVKSLFMEDIKNIYTKISLFAISSNKKQNIKKIIYLNELQNYTFRNKKKHKNYNNNSISKLKKLVLNSNNKNKISKEIKKLNIDLLKGFRKHRFTDLNIKNIKKNLNKNQILIKYIILKNDLYIVYTTKNKTNYIVKKNIVKNLIYLINSLTNPLDDFTNGKVDYLRVQFNINASIQLYNLLLKDVLTINKNIKNIFIIPDDILFTLPFETLITEKKNNNINKNILFSKYKIYSYLIEKHSISYYFSVFQFLNSPKEIYNNKKYKFAFFGNPIITNKMQLLFKPLQSTVSELNLISKNYTNILSFTKNNFNLLNFRKYAKQSDIIHIATHYLKNKDFPNFSSLLFSKNKNNKSQFCYAYDIYNSELNNKLVVLSACESSDKNLIGLNGLTGIVNAFKNAGTKSIIVSLWPVDQYNSTLLPIFYKYLEKQKNYSKQSISNALRLSKIEFIKKIEEITPKLKISYSHPFLWSNFILYNLN